jgi:predicted DNA binding CopG/RHH family protein
MNFDPFKNLVLDEYEQEIEDSIDESADPKPSLTPELKKHYEEAASKTLQQIRKSKPITLRVNAGDLAKVKARAQKAGLPYQTLLSSLIHNYAEGQVKIEL